MLNMRIFARRDDLGRLKGVAHALLRAASTPVLMLGAEGERPPGVRTLHAESSALRRPAMDRVCGEGGLCYRSLPQNSSQYRKRECPLFQRAIVKIVEIEFISQLLFLLVAD
jgi:hypothetical protein